MGGETTKAGEGFQANLDINSIFYYVLLYETHSIHTAYIRFLPLTTLCRAEVVNVACVGDSITFGSRVENRAKNNYPAQLERILGNGYRVENFGVSGRTMLSKGDLPWINHPYYKPSAAYEPDIVVIKLGTNAAKPVNWNHKAEFLSDTLKLIDYFKAPPLPSAP